MELLDPYGGTAAMGKVTPDPEWVSAATSARQVLVLFGPRLGIRVPPGRTAASYTAQEQLREFHQCRHDGQLIAAAVAWCGPQNDKALHWILLREGSLGLALPLAYVPAASFRAHGGAEAFGFTTFLPPSAPINEPSLARGLAAELTTTDLDLIRPDLDRDVGWVCGYRPGKDNEKFFEAWRQEAQRRGFILVASGDKDFPIGGPDRAERALKVLMESVVAAVPLTPSSCSSAASVGSASPDTAAQPAKSRQEEYSKILTDKLRSLESYEVYVADTLAELIPRDELQRWITNLWPVVCQTCGEPLGTKADISADGIFENGKVLVSMHHSACRPSGITPPDGRVKLCGPTSSFVIGYLGDTSGEPTCRDIPAMVINPSCEQLMLAPDGCARWRNATLDDFASLGFAPANRNIPPLIRGMNAEMRGDRLNLTVTADLPPHAAEYRWAIEPPSHVREQVRRFQTLAVAVTTKVLPSLITPDDLPAAFVDPEALVGRVYLAKSHRPRQGSLLARLTRPYTAGHSQPA